MLKLAISTTGTNLQKLALVACKVVLEIQVFPLDYFNLVDVHPILPSQISIHLLFHVFLRTWKLQLLLCWKLEVYY
jgi:hypothetical protein